MRVGQLGAATAMVFATRSAEPWHRFWRWLSVVAGAKTVLAYVSLGAPQEFGGVLTLLTIGVVAVFVVVAARWWRRGELREPPSLAGAPRFGLVASLGLWAAFAVAPRYAH